MRLQNEVARVRQFRESLRALSADERRALVRGLGDGFADSWEIRARDEQLPPAGDWWALIQAAGRGWGKTRALSGTIHMAVRAGYRRIHLVCPSFRDVIDVMVDGPSGILNTAPAGERPRWVASRHRVEWDSGATVTCFSAENYEALRGPQCQLALVDELAKMPEAEEVFAGTMYGLRLGPDKPRLIVASTPRPTAFWKRLVKMDGVVVTGGSTFDNARNLPADFLKQITELYDGTRTGRQELHGELLVDVPGALFKEHWLRRAEVPAEMLETVTVGVDPSSGTVHGDATGIVVAAMLKGGRDYAVLEDCTLKGSPGLWGDTVVQAHDRHHAVDVVVESNHGGNLAKHVIEEAARRAHHIGKRENSTIRIRMETASKGKVMRAHAVSLLYEKGAVTHVPGLDKLENEMMGFSDDWDRGRDGSPNHLDAAVWALERLRGIKRVIMV